jgi:hypothetical protein
MCLVSQEPSHHLLHTEVDRYVQKPATGHYNKLYTFIERSYFLFSLRLF